MKLKTRLLLALVIAILVPVAMGSLAIYGVGQYFLGLLRQTYGIGTLTYADLISPVLITGQGELVPEARSMIQGFTFVIIVVILMTVVVTYYWIYHSIISPLDRLSRATKNIQEGNLNFTMQGMQHTNDELGELCDNFELMRRRLAEQAEEKLAYDKENKELISNISHDLKTPITAVKGYVEGIMDGVADTPEKMDRYIRTIYNKANDMDALIDELTFYSKIDTNRIPYTFSRLNVVRFFGDCAEELELELTAKDIELTYINTVAKNVEIIGDAEQLRRVINNIVGNSVKYLGTEPGKIRLTVKDMGADIMVSLEDNGRGIAPKDLPYIFDRFYRTDSSRNSSKGGSGIGLSIVKKIIEDHSGRIWAASTEGKGTTMTFVVRKYAEEPQAEEPEEAEQAKGKQRRERSRRTKKERTKGNADE